MKWQRATKHKKSIQSKIAGTVLLFILLVIGLSLIIKTKSNKLERRIDNRQEIVEQLKSGPG